MPIGVELEMSLLVDVVTPLVVAVLPAVVDVDGITWVVSMGVATVNRSVHICAECVIVLSYTNTTC